MGRVVCRQIWNFLGRKGAKNMGAGWLQSQPVRKPGARISFRNSGGVFRSHIFCALPALEVHLPKPRPPQLPLPLLSHNLPQQKNLTNASPSLSHAPQSYPPSKNSPSSHYPSQICSVYGPQPFPSPSSSATVPIQTGLAGCTHLR